MTSWMWKNACLRRSLILITLICVTLLLWISRISIMKNMNAASAIILSKDIRPSIINNVVKERLVHLDLKGAPPKLTYLKELIVNIKSLGATGLLIEYEDMFPFEGNLSKLSAGNAYERSELKTFLNFCAEQNMTVIPLVQTFGHMEYILKLKEFSHLREDPHSPRELCPRQRDTLIFIELLLKQIIEFHLQLPIKFTHIHIGCDEVYQMGICPLCKGSERSQFFLQHIMNVINIVKNNWPHLKVIIWDDMLRKIPLEILQQAKIGGLVEPMVWWYAPYDISELRVWKNYEEIFPALWAASAFKGASMPRRILPPIQRHLDNNREWLRFIAKDHQESYRNVVQGLVLTGWQRYNHFAVLCELLPAAIPSLFITLFTISHGNAIDSLDYKELYKIFRCPPNFDLPPFELSEYHPIFWNCEYLGHETYRLLLDFSQYVESAQKLLRELEYENADFTLYHMDHKFLMPSQINEKIEIEIKTLKMAARTVHEALSDIYDEFTIGEYIEQQIYSLLKPLQEILNKAQKSENQTYWPQRPFEVPKHIKELY